MRGAEMTGNTLTRALFGSPSRVLITLALALAAILILPGLFRWAVLDATFSGTPEQCRAAGGACWAFLAAKWQLILFGAYPRDQLWRPALFLGLFAGVMVTGWSLRVPQRIVMGLLLAVLVAGIILMRGGVPGLPVVTTSQWGGLPVTVLVSLAGLTAAFPLGVLLLLAATSNISALRLPARLYIAITRGIPAITLVFMTFAIVPLLMPPDRPVDKLLRASIGLSLLSAAYFAEALRGGREALPKGQNEAAESLGLGYWRRQGLVILPQVIANSLAPIANISIAFVKNTSLLVIIGLMDLLGAGRASLMQGGWQGSYRELYLFLGLVYFLICLGIERFWRSSAPPPRS